MEYTALARRYRPQSFGEVVGQSNVAQALRNAITSDRVSHAYLFTGARGVGKTSMARILAKSLNCPQAQDGNPCNECEVCRSISTGSDVDVLEIDGASNRGIEDIRSLRANVNVRSMRSRYKIYIIDEVHMLTRDAFNALLKTLEEPPPNVKFVFCTTEPQKLPDTILSRCQRFDFGMIATLSIMDRLAQIAAGEGMRVEPAAMELVARRAAGSMRDSQSLFDQLLAFGGETITPADVHRLLGTAPDERLIEMVQALVERRGGDALRLLNESLTAGVQLSEFSDQLVGYLRDLMVLAAGAREVTLVSVAEEHRAALAAQAEAWGLQTILAALQILAETKSRMRGATYARALAELALVRLSLLEDLDELAHLVQQVQSAPGGASSAPRTPAQRSVPTAGSSVPAPASPAPAAPPQKKNDIDSSATVSEAPPEASGPPVDTRKTIPLESGCEAAILAELLDSLKDMSKNYVKHVSSVAISGPNKLVFTFPKSYHSSKQYLERSEQVARLEQVLGKIVGKPVRVSFVIDESAQEVHISDSSATPVEPAASKRTDPGKDPFVRKVISVFGATVVN